MIYNTTIPPGTRLPVRPLPERGMVDAHGACLRSLAAKHFVVHEPRNDILIRGVMVGDRLQMPLDCRLLAIFFGPDTPGNDVLFDVAEPGEIVSIEVENLGDVAATFKAEVY